MSKPRQIIKILIPVIVIAILSACVSTETQNPNEPAMQEYSPPSLKEQGESGHWISRPTEGNLVIIGVSGNMSSNRLVISNALDDAAAKVSMYNGITVTYENRQNQATNFFDYENFTKITIDYDTELEHYKERLKYDPEKDVIDAINAHFIRCTYPASFSGNLQYQIGKNSNGSPRWTTNPPNEIGGYLVGVGYAGRQSTLAKTITASCQSAAAALVIRKSSSLETYDLDAVSQNKNTSTNKNTATQKSSGKLTGFLVLETWIDKDSRVWTLAIAQKD